MPELLLISESRGEACSFCGTPGKLVTAGTGSKICAGCTAGALGLFLQGRDARPSSPGHRPALPTITRACEVIASHFGLSVASLKGRTHSRTVSLARNIALFVAQERTRASLHELGEAFGDRDHSTVKSGIARVRRLLADGDDQVRAALAAVDDEIGPVSSTTLARAA